MENLTITNQDCIEGLKKLKNDSVDLVFADLPYLCTDCKWDQEGVDLDKLAKELWRVAKTYCTLVFTCKFKFGMDIVNALGKKWFRYDMVWHKTRACGFLNSNRMPLCGHENVLIFYKKCQSAIYKKKRALHHKLASKIENKNFDGKRIYGSRIIKSTPLRYRTKYDPPIPTSVMTIANHNHKTNTNATQKPLELVEFFIKYYTDRDDKNVTLLDPTIGSGTSAIAALKWGIKFVGFEKNKEQFDGAMNRINNHLNPKKNKIIKVKGSKTYGFYDKGGIAGLKGRAIALKKDAEKNKIIKP